MKRHCVLSLAVALACGAALGVTGCGKQQSAKPRKAPDAVKAPPPPKPRIALVMRSAANEFSRAMEKAARAYQLRNTSAFDLVCNSIKDEQDTAGQIDLVEQMIAQKVNAIVIAPVDPKALVPVCGKAVDAGAVVVNIESRFDPDALAEKNIKIPFVGPDERKGARTAAAYLAKQLKAGDKVAIVEGATNSFSAAQRKLGFEDAMKALGADIVSSQSGNGMADQAEKAVSGIIVQHSDLKALLCADDNMAIGALAALKVAGKIEQVLIVGYDNIPAVQKLTKQGRILCTIDQHVDQIAVYAIDYALETTRRQGATSDSDTPVDLITAGK